MKTFFNKIIAKIFHFNENKLLPLDFFPETYLELNPDVKKAGISAKRHYLKWGRFENRLYRFPIIKIDKSKNYFFKKTKPSLLIVSHEASLTGAPVLAFNITKELIKKYNVTIFLLGEGVLLDTFIQLGAAVLLSSESKNKPLFAKYCINELCNIYQFKYAIVNSIESQTVLQSLSFNKVPSILLMHEFCSYTRPKYAIKEAFFWLTRVVFSANLTLENAKKNFHEIDFSSAAVIPQGKCVVPRLDISESKKEENVIEKINQFSGDCHLILGAGYVQYRKGVDLFIEAANEIINKLERKDFKFLWVGGGYDHDHDLNYSVYLADQIQRLNLQEHILFLNETSLIEEVYKRADILLLSSRLDPFPNVAIDAMVIGLPIICFDLATGISEFLHEINFRKVCVSPYLNTSDLALKILELLSSKEKYKKLSAAIKKASIKKFNMQSYVKKLDELGAEASLQNSDEILDTQEILNSGLLQNNFYQFSDNYYLSERKLVRYYVRSWVNGFYLRKPFPGFNPAIYREVKRIDKNTDPFAHFLRSGCPDGFWKTPVIIYDKSSPKLDAITKTVALHIHVFYLDLLADIIERLTHNINIPDLFISVNSKEAKKQALKILNSFNIEAKDIQIVPNVGRDIAPFVTVFGPRLLSKYEYIGHIHTKKSLSIDGGEVGSKWFDFLLTNLIGRNKLPMMDTILNAFENDQNLGLVFPDDPNILGWGENKDQALLLIKRLGMNLKSLPEYFNFPMGTMFWVRSKALMPLLELKLGVNDYPKEPLPYDGTILHAFERLLPFVANDSGFSINLTNVPGLTR